MLFFFNICAIFNPFAVLFDEFSVFATLAGNWEITPRLLLDFLLDIQKSSLVRNLKDKFWISRIFNIIGEAHGEFNKFRLRPRFSLFYIPLYLRRCHGGWM